MMKPFVVAICLVASGICAAQDTIYKEPYGFTHLYPKKSTAFRPQSVEISYLGETITHPGLKVGVTYELTSWQKKKAKKERIIVKSIDVSPAIGMFFHKNYQTALFVLPELGYSRKNMKTGSYVKFGIGAGYMRTFIPNVYDLTPSGEIRKIHPGYNYFLTNYSVRIGKDRSVKAASNTSPSLMRTLDYYIKPQFMYAIPGVPRGVGYFAVEIGVSWKLADRNK